MFSHHSGSQQDKIKVSAGSAPPRGPRGASFLASYPGGSQCPLAPASAPVFVAFFPLWLCPSPLLLRTPVIGLRACSKPRMISSQEPWLITWSLLYFQTKAYADLWADIHFFFFSEVRGTLLDPLPSMWKDPVLSSQDPHLNALPSACLILLHRQTAAYVFGCNNRIFLNHRKCYS